MFSINLVPEVQQKKQKVAKRNTLVTIISIVILGSCVAGLVIMGIIQGVKISQKNSAEEEIRGLEQEAEQYKDLEETVISLEKGLAGINEINDGNYTWTKLLPHIENATPNDIQFTNLTIEGSSISANLKGKTINSLARFMDSFKDYQVVSLSGTGAAGEILTISIDGGSESKVTVKSNGEWTHAMSFDPTKDHSMLIIKEGQEVKVGYNAETKQLTSPEDYSVNTSVSNLFPTVETTQYKKEGSEVSFDATIEFSKELIW